MILYEIDSYNLHIKGKVLFSTESTCYKTLIRAEHTNYPHPLWPPLVVSLMVPNEGIAWVLPNLHGMEVHLDKWWLQF